MNTVDNQAQAKTVRILLVEDDPSYARMVVRAYERNPDSDLTVDFRPAFSAPEAVRLLDEEPFDLILLDWVLANGSRGEALLRHIRTLSPALRIPVIVVSGAGGYEGRAEALRLGAADYLTKTGDLTLLRTVVREVLEAAEKARAPQWRSAAARVLHVEDEEEWTQLVATWLSETGWALHHVPSSSSLMRFLRTCVELPDCIVLDLTLPESDGLDLCRALKEDPAFQGIPLVVLSARSGDRLAALEHLALNLVGKDSAAARELPATLRSVVSQQERAAGVLERGDLRLDPRGNRVFVDRHLVSTLDKTGFSLLRALVENSPDVVSDEELRSITKRRDDYRRRNSADPKPCTMQVYVSSLRNRVGDSLGHRIVRVHGVGYAYMPGRS